MPCLKAIQKTDQARHPSSPSTASRNWSPNSCKLCAVQTLQQRHSKKKGTKHRGCPHQCLSISCWAPRAANVIRHQGFPFVQGQVLIHWETTFPNSCSVDKEILGDEESAHETPTHPNSLHHPDKESQRQSLQTIHRSSITQEDHLLL